MESTIFIKKAKIIDGMFLELEFSEVEADGDKSISNDIKGLYRKIIHEDLVKAFNNLRVHLAFLTEIVPIGDYESFDDSAVYEDERFSKFRVGQFSIGGEGENEGVTITGQKKLRGKKILNLNSPFTKFEEQKGIDNYQFLHELYHDVRICKTEVELYLQGKHASNPQLDIFDESNKALNDSLRDIINKGGDVDISLGTPE